MWSLGRTKTRGGKHTGDDWNTPVGTPAYAMTNGRVRSVSRTSAYGLQVAVDRTDGVTERWSISHLSKALVKTGQAVVVGQKIALTGATGNVSGPHAHVERRRPPYTFSLDAIRDPQPLYAVAARKVRAAWATLRPAKAPARLYSATFRNLAGFDALGKDGKADTADDGDRTIAARLVRLLDDLVSDRDEVVGVVELPNRLVDQAKRLMWSRGYRWAGGTDGRHLFARRDVTILRHATFELWPRYQGDDKQAAAAVLEIDGNATTVSVAHLESAAAADQVRVEQAQNALWKHRKLAPGTPDHDLLMGDWNSDTWVRERAFNEAKYVDCAETAWKHTNGLLATLTRWLKPKSGARIDAFFVYRTRPVLEYETVNRGPAVGLADHLRIRVVLGHIA